MSFTSLGGEGTTSEKLLLAVCVSLPTGINMIFPFLPFMIHDFFPYLDKTELGVSWLAGWLGGGAVFCEFN